MSTSRSSPAARRQLDRLAALKFEPARQAEQAAAMIEEGDAPAEALTAALTVLAAHPLHRARPAIAAKLDGLLAAGRKRDPGGFLRAALCRALAPIALGEDAGRFAAACETHEPTPLDQHAPSVLRAAGVAGLAGVEPDLGAIYAVRL